EPQAFFIRVQRTAGALNCSGHRVSLSLPKRLREVRTLLRIIWAIGIADPTTRVPFWRVVLSSMRRNPASLKRVLMLSAMYLHLGPFSRYVLTLTERHKAAGDTPTGQGPA